ncbi:VWA domain-containing protein [Actinocorallia sp. API 0066]|uniref:vWA domain-containing protein n=1 Tax=Actinocorallia sp. API 0066 TaxID=2896846 RepID=UPI001E32EC1E|nr:VWA domain-containing protein [Actinocorallia sp. API 0066]MCD0447620.1 VWA domain-containing protein [Actinocorallia sp. API 0066]
MSQQVLPFYLVCDESSSMSGGPVDAINDSLIKIHQEIGANPVVADKTRFCLISFSDHAQVLLPLSDMSNVTSMPALQANGGTSFAAAFDVLRDTIAQDVARLKSEGHQVLRPAVFFLTDGQPLDSSDWPASYQRLTDPSWGPRPNILAFAFGGYDLTTIQQIATIKAFVHDGSMGPAEALREFAQKLIQSIVRSGTSAAPGGGMSLALPDNVPGFTAVPADVI